MEQVGVLERQAACKQVAVQVLVPVPVLGRADHETVRATQPRSHGTTTGMVPAASQECMVGNDSTVCVGDEQNYLLGLTVKSCSTDALYVAKLTTDATGMMAGSEECMVGNDSTVCVGDEQNYLLGLTVKSCSTDALYVAEVATCASVITGGWLPLGQTVMDH